MKKLLSLILVLLLALTPCAVADNLPYEKYDTLINYLESGNYEMAFMEVSRLASEAGNGANDGMAETSASGEVFVPECNGTDWMFHMDLINYTDSQLTMQKLEIFNLLNGTVIGEPFVFSGDQLNSIGFNSRTLASGSGFGWDDAHPVVSDFDARDYVFTFTDENGVETEMVFSYDMSGSTDTQSSDGSFVRLVPETDGSEWRFHINLSNSTDSTLTLIVLEVFNILNGEITGEPFEFAGDRLDDIGLGSVTLAPGENLWWNDNHPVVSDFDARDYVFTFSDENGAETAMVFSYDMSGSTDAQQEVSGDWQFNIVLTNDGDSPITLQALTITDMMNGTLVSEPCVFSGEQLGNIGLANVVLNPGDTRNWNDGHPVVDHFNFREYSFTFTDANGNEVVQSFPYDLSGSVQQQEQQQETSGDWQFNIVLTNDGDSPLTLQALTITDMLNGTPIDDPYVFSSEQLGNIGLANVVLNPGDTRNWNDGHPVVDRFNFREYSFTFTDANGNEVVQSFPYDLSGSTQQNTAPTATLPDYSQDEGKDLLTLRHDAAFSAEVARGVFWVPACALGESRYTNADIYAMLSASPEQKQADVATLYEALQLYQISGFYSSDDNQRISENGVNWEHHKPGYDAVRTNTGCCATDSNWLNYILQGDYEEVGYVATSQRDGSGHIYNYLKQDGWYYFIDLTHYRTDWVATAVENGEMSAYYNSDFVLGNIHRSTSVQAFVDYVQSAFTDAPGMMFMYTAENCLALDSARRNDGTVIIYEDDPAVNMQIIYDDPDDSLSCEFVTPPQNHPDWSLNPDYAFPQ